MASNVAVKYLLLMGVRVDVFFTKIVPKWMR